MSLDSISRDERDAPLMQYIKNNTLQMLEYLALGIIYTITHFCLQKTQFGIVE